MKFKGLDLYQSECSKTAFYPKIGRNFIYPTIGLMGEAGEVANKIKKVIRDDKSKISSEKREELKAELGDVMWYVSQLCTELGLKLSEVAEFNIKKLSSRKDRGKLGGSGDNR